ncbi:MAG: hypothetical protein ACOCP4_03255 [Candidatus Woesearchaeota archaeon]
MDIQHRISLVLFIVGVGLILYGLFGYVDGWPKEEIMTNGLIYQINLLYNIKFILMGIGSLLSANYIKQLKLASK